ncbi:hypothetical protein BDQ17DRAFT_551504 [Cyathus striatus]|nr:hypothetical protein BDQ17DRAFT_551504 [Cyathus striatus]
MSMNALLGLGMAVRLHLVAGNTRPILLLCSAPQYRSCSRGASGDVVEDGCSAANGRLGSSDKNEISSSLNTCYDEASSSTDGIDGSESRDAEGICPLNFAAHLSSTSPTHECAANAQAKDISDSSREPQEQGDRCISSVSLLLASGAGKVDIPRESRISNCSVSHVGSPPQSSMSDFPMQHQTPSKSVIETGSMSHKTTSTSGLDMRARLLERLEKEKANSDSLCTQASDDEAGVESRPLSGSTPIEEDNAPHPTSVLDRISSRFDNTRCRSMPLDTSGKGPGLDTTSNGAAADANALEARLRARAQLRARLASEKRAVGIVSRSN